MARQCRLCAVGWLQWWVRRPALVVKNEGPVTDIEHILNYPLRRPVSC